ncbi:MAG: CHASE2 domain-containing protein, partial [Candidatus Melainabacteria bacterium]|nr:CHASE2 domain-containing protein [Candidatus Melainabacteria bacterium]
MFGIVLELSHVLRRQELQTINKRFEARPWLNWSSEGLKRLNLPLLWQYHQAHEIPCKWWAWDYTLSWLLEHNHLPIKHKVVIFNHLLEDEPPSEAIEHHPWMKPLLAHPLPRQTLAEIIEFLASSGARLIILDNDFPQYTQDDYVLAKAIHLSTSGGFGSRVPVLMARTVNRRSSGTVLQLEVPTTPSGIVAELGKLEPNTDIIAKYTGITGIMPDEDQVVRRLALKLPGLTGVDHESIVVNALRKLHEPIAANTPDVLDIDFVAPPNSELYPVRPLSYLLDPKHKQQLAHPATNSQDVTLSGAIVVLGDSVIDVFSTPFTNEGLNQMSGSEILVQALETLSRGHWPQRLDGKQAILYLLLCSLAAGFIWTSWKVVQQVTMSSFRDIGLTRLLRSLSDLWCFILILCGAYLVACMLFAWKGLIVPVFVPALSLGLGTIGSLLWEREQEREETFKVKLQAAQDKLVLAHERYEADLKRQEAEAKAREVLLDRQRRHEFVRRINHDLNAPVSVLNWTLAELQGQDVDQQESKDKIGRLVKTSDKLCELIDQLVQSYDYETTTETRQIETTNMSKVIEDSLDLQRPLAEMHTSSLTWSLPPATLWVHGNALELSRIIDNIVRNAIKHNPGGTKVIVEVK